MTETKPKLRRENGWATFLKFFSEQNKGRRTRLGVFEKMDGVVNDYWVEDGLPLEGIDVDDSGDLPGLQIMLEGYSHSIAKVRTLTVHYSLHADEDGLDIAESDGKLTVLRFEKD